MSNLSTLPARARDLKNSDLVNLGVCLAGVCEPVHTWL